MCRLILYNTDFLSGSVDKNSPANSGGMGLIPGPGRFHMPWSNQTCEAQLPKCSTREATAMRSPCTPTKSSPRSLQLEKAHASQPRPSTIKTKQIKLYENILQKNCEFSAIISSIFSPISFFSCWDSHYKLVCLLLCYSSPRLCSFFKIYFLLYSTH